RRPARRPRGSATQTGRALPRKPPGTASTTDASLWFSSPFRRGRRKWARCSQQSKRRAVPGQSPCAPPCSPPSAYPLRSHLSRSLGGRGVFSAPFPGSCSPAPGHEPGAPRRPRTAELVACRRLPVPLKWKRFGPFRRCLGARFVPGPPPFGGSIMTRRAPVPVLLAAIAWLTLAAAAPAQRRSHNFDDVQPEEFKSLAQRLGHPGEDPKALSEQFLLARQLFESLSPAEKEQLRQKVEDKLNSMSPQSREKLSRSLQNREVTPEMRQLA